MRLPAEAWAARTGSAFDDNHSQIFLFARAMFLALVWPRMVRMMINLSEPARRRKVCFGSSVVWMLAMVFMMQMPSHANFEFSGPMPPSGFVPQPIPNKCTLDVLLPDFVFVDATARTRMQMVHTPHQFSLPYLTTQGALQGQLQVAKSLDKNPSASAFAVTTGDTNFDGGLVCQAAFSAAQRNASALLFLADWGTWNEMLSQSTIQHSTLTNHTLNTTTTTTELFAWTPAGCVMCRSDLPLNTTQRRQDCLSGPSVTPSPIPMFRFSGLDYSPLFAAASSPAPALIYLGYLEPPAVFMTTMTLPFFWILVNLVL